MLVLSQKLVVRGSLWAGIAANGIEQDCLLEGMQRMLKFGRSTLVLSQKLGVRGSLWAGITTNGIEQDCLLEGMQRMLKFGIISR